MIVYKKTKLGIDVKKILIIAICSLFCLGSLSSATVIPYSKENKVYKEFHKLNTYSAEYENGGNKYRKNYEGEQEKNGVSYSKEGISDGDVIACFSSNENLATRKGNNRKFHEIYGMVGEEGTVLSKVGSTKGANTPYDMTSIKSFDAIQENLTNGFRDNGTIQRYCNSKQLQGSGNGEYDTPKIYCEAGMETTNFIGLVEDPYTGKIPTCKLTLDSDIRIDDVRYLRQVISPDNTSGDDAENYSMGNGLVKCAIKNGSLFLEMLDNPEETTSCNELTYSTINSGKGCCNPITGFGCNAQFCQYGSDKHCKGESIPSIGSCTFKSTATVFVKGILTLSTESGGSGTFKCLETGNWLVQSTTGC
jgi:hypothetical protein